MTAVVYPVGHYTGVVPSAFGPAERVVRVGLKQHRIPEDAFGLWVLAHGPAEPDEQPWTRRRLLGQAAEIGLTANPDQLAELEQSGLVVSVDPSRREAADFARAYRLDVLMIGLGESPERPGHHLIGTPEVGPVATLDPDSYELWQWAPTLPSLWASCELRSAVTARDGQTADPNRALAGVLRDLRLLVLYGCGYLDVSRTERSDHRPGGTTGAVAGTPQDQGVGR